MSMQQVRRLCSGKRCTSALRLPDSSPFLSFLVPSVLFTLIGQTVRNGGQERMSKLGRCLTLLLREHVMRRVYHKRQNWAQLTHISHLS